MKYKEWLQSWLALYVKPTVKTRTYEKYEELIHLHILPYLGECDISEFTAVYLQRYVVHISANGNTKNKGGELSSSMVNGIITVLQSSLKQAVNLGVIEIQFADKIHRPKTKEKPVECFTISEQKKLEQYILNGTKPKFFGIVLCLYTGLRIGELLALEWTDIDFKKAFLSVSKTCYDGKTGRLTGTPKTSNSKRIIPIPKQLLPLLKKHKIANLSKYVVSANGEYISVRSYQRSFELLLKKLKISHRGFHTIRHTFATRALECGMDVKTLSEILGHKNPTITLNRYAHSLMEHKSEMMNRLGKLL